MTREELKIILDEEWIPPFEYSFFGENDKGDTSYIMELMRDRRWMVYTQDRGERFSIKYFETEHDACKYIYDRLTGFYNSLSDERKKAVREHIKKHYR